MAKQLLRWLGVALVVAGAGGCGTSAPPNFYTLESTATATASALADYGVMVGPVSVPATVDRPEFVLLIAPNRVEVDDFNRWAAPLGEGIARTVAGDLAELLGTPDVAVAPFANFDPTYRVTINVQRFDSVLGSHALVEAVWTVRATAGGQAHSGRTLAREEARGDDFTALAAAHSRALAKLSADIATSVRALADAR